MGLINNKIPYLLGGIRVKKLIKVIGRKDEFMDDGKQFCTKGKEYNIKFQNKEEFTIISDLEAYHDFAYNECDWFELIYEEN